MPKFKVPTPDGEFVVTAPQKPANNEEALKLVHEQYYAKDEAPAASSAAPPAEDRGSEGGSWLPTIGEAVGSGGGAMAAGPLGAGAGAMVGRTAGSVLAGEGIPDLGSLAMTGAANASGEAVFATAGKLVKRLTGVSAFQRGAESIMSKLSGMTDTQPLIFGRKLRDAINGPMERKVAHQTAKLYNDLTETADRLKIAIPEPNRAISAAKEFIEKHISDPSLAADPAMAKKVTDQLQKVIDFAGKNPGFNDYFKGYRELQGLFDDYAKIGMPSTVQEAAQKQVLGAMKSDIEAAIRGTAAERKYTVANRYFDMQKAPFRELMFRQAADVLREEPSRLINEVIQPGHPEAFLSWWRPASKEMRTGLRSAWLRQTLEGAYNPMTKAYDPGALMNAYYGMDASTRRQLFHGAEAEYKQLFDHLSKAFFHKDIAGAAGGLVRGFGPGGLTAHALYSAMRGNFTEALASAGAAGVLAEAMSEPRIVQFFARGINMKPGSVQAIVTGRKLVGALVSTGLIDPAAQGAMGYGQGYGQGEAETLR